jgi:hypothetical protein
MEKYEYLKVIPLSVLLLGLYPKIPQVHILVFVHGWDYVLFMYIFFVFHVLVYVLIFVHGWDYVLFMYVFYMFHILVSALMFVHGWDYI